MVAARGEAVERAAAERAEPGREALPVLADERAALSGAAPLGRMRRGLDGGGLLACCARGVGGGEGSEDGGRICR